MPRHRGRVRANPVETETDAEEELIEALEAIERVHASVVALGEVVSPDFGQHQAADTHTQAILDGLNAAARPIANALAVLEVAEVGPEMIVRFEDDPQYGHTLESILEEFSEEDDDEDDDA